MFEEQLKKKRNQRRVCGKLNGFVKEKISVNFVQSLL